MQANIGDTVRVQFTAKLPNDAIVANCVGHDTLQFTLGKKEVIPGLEQAVIGMSPGDTKTTKLLPRNAFGPYRQDLMWKMDRASLPRDVQGKIGERLEIRLPEGEVLRAEVTQSSGNKVLLDANHPLAGRDLLLDVELVDIVAGPH